MPEVSAYPPGTPSWVDLGTKDVDAAAAFYRGLFGWEVQEPGPDTGGYRMAMYRGRPVAGLGPAAEEGPPYWTTYVSVVDADATAVRVTDAGGTVVMPPMDVLTFGRMAIFQDPGGAVFAVWQPGDHLGAGVVNEPNTLSWNELGTRDPEAARAFYGAVFGWEAELDAGGTYTMWQVGGRTVGGMLTMGDQFPPEVPSAWMPYFAVEDCDAAVAKVQELGGSVLMPGMDIEPGRFAVVADSQGAVFTVMKMEQFDPAP